MTALLPLGIVVAFTQYAWDSRVVQGKSLRASWLGGWNGIAYYVMLAVPVIRNALGIGWPWDWLVQAMAWALVLTTCASILDRAMASANGRDG